MFISRSAKDTDLYKHYFDAKSMKMLLFIIATLLPYFNEYKLKKNARSAFLLQEMSEINCSKMVIFLIMTLSTAYC
jgi:hypothetical protein